MRIIAGVLISVAAGALFFLAEPFLLGLAQPWRWLTALAVAFGAGVAAYLIERQTTPPPQTPRKVLAENEAGKGMEINASDVDMTGSHGKVLSGNKAKGSMKITISDSKF